MKFVTGIGGVFFRARDPAVLSAWYERELGIAKVPEDYSSSPWQQQAGPTVFAPFPEDTTYFGSSTQMWMINLRVQQLDELVARLREHGIDVQIDSQTYPNGRFARLHDPEGNPIELWEPKTPSNAPELS
jgi:predicted enzyme related to lactoylglutathione lyase